MSKQRNNQTSKSKNTEDDAVSNAEPSIDLSELEQVLRSFNDEATKREVCKQIKNYEATIEEIEPDPPVSQGSQEEVQPQPTKQQKITLPVSGKVIRAQGNSLKQACELVDAWFKTRNTASIEDGAE